MIHSYSLHKLNLLFALSIISLSTSSQTLNDFGFEYWNHLEVIIDSVKIRNPWIGGLNNVQFGEIDLNNDGVTDIVAFDRHGNRLLPFLFHKTADPYYEYVPSYRKFFPKILHTFQLCDYNGDHKPDIFTYTPGGIMVYRNTSSEFIRFEKASYPFIKSLQGNTFTNLLVTNVDYPSIMDMDNDGDLDILTFWGLGSFVELHQNMSVETYGNADSLLYHKVDYCWGQFAEDAASNQLILDTCLDLSKRDDDRHTGSTLRLLDINQDKKLDLLLGDVDFSNIKVLINGADNMHAHMVQQIDSFPTNYPIRVPSFPAIGLMDVYHDNVQNIIISPFDPGLLRAAGEESVWLYNIAPTGEFNLLTKSFLQDEMIDEGLGGYPVFVKFTNDGLTDLLVSNYGRMDTSFYNQYGQFQCRYVSSISLYKNTGTQSSPQFTLITRDVAGLSNLDLVGIYPAIGDVNNDGLLDMLIGSSDHSLRLLINTGFINDVPLFSDPVIIPVETNGTFCTPAFTDINSDGKIDIVTGDRTGKLSLFLNNGTNTVPQFSLVTNHYGHVNVTDSTQSYTGYSVPCFFNDKNGKLKMLVGSESGKIFYYPDLLSDPEGVFIAKHNDVFEPLNAGIRTSCALSDLNYDGYPELAIGNYGGGIVMMKGVTPEPSAFEEMEGMPRSINLYPNPSNGKVTIELPLKGNWNIEIYNSFGMKVYTKFTPSANRITFDIKKLRSGLYIVTASQQGNSNDILTSKLIITP
ncbi:MAG: T9SS type A sorting domain-containing protein [Lentimicrobiaceae bacterium]